MVVAALNTAVSIYYYLNLIRHAYTVEAEGETAIPATGGSLFWGGALAALLLLLGVLPAPVLRWAEAAGRQLVP